MAASKGRHDIVSLLLSKGADPDTVDKVIMSYFMYIYITNKSYGTVFHVMINLFSNDQFSYLMF